MLQFHDTTRRRICRAAFVLLCIVPTVAVSAWCAWRNRPGHVDAEARRLGRELGIDVSLEDVEHVRPGKTLYRGLLLADPETGQPVGRCQALDAEWTDVTDQQGHSRTTLVLTASLLEIDSAATAQLGRMLEHVMRRPIAATTSHVELRVPSVTLRAGERVQALDEVSGGIWPLPTGTQLHVQFRLPGSHAFEPVRLSVARNRRTVPPTTTFELVTGDTSMPCTMLALGLPAMEPLGPGSQFCGHIWATEVFDDRSPAGWNAYVTGQLTNIDFGRLVTDRFPHTLSGTGSVNIQTASIRRERLEEAEGVLHVRQGKIGRALIKAAAERLHLIAGPQPETSADPIPYEQLAVAFKLDGQGLRLHGRCRRANPNAILVDRRSRLLSNPSAMRPRPVLALLRTLVPDEELQVPASRQTEWLMRHLPVPEAPSTATAKIDRRSIP